MCDYREFDQPYIAECTKYAVTVSGREGSTLVFKQFPESLIQLPTSSIDKLTEAATASLTKVVYERLTRNAPIPSPLEKKKGEVCCGDSSFLLGVHLPLEVRLRVQVRHLVPFLLDDDGFEKEIKYMPLVRKVGNVCGLRCCARCSVESLQELLAECVEAVGIPS